MGGRGPVLEGQLYFYSLMQRVEVQRRKVHDWHLCFALISAFVVETTTIARGRRLSARNPGPASPVETFHPRIEFGLIIPDFYMIYSAINR